MAKLFTALLVLTLSACMTPNKPPAQKNNWRADASYFDAVRATYQARNNWLYKARVGVTTPAGREAASMVWEFSDQANTVRLFGPLGVGAVKIEFDDYGVVLSDNKGVLHRGQSAQALLERIVGWPIPVDALAHWLFLVPKPNIAFRYQTNEDQRLATLEQLGWRIEYSAYQDFNGQQLPRKMLATRERASGEKVTVRLVSKAWQWQEG